MRHAANLLVLLVAACSAIACGAKPAPVITPTLPGDGDTNTAKPPPPKPKPAADPWDGKELIGPPPIAPPQAIDLPPVRSFKLSNGLDVEVIPDANLPVVSVQLAIRAGRDAEPRARLGVAELTADMLIKGTRRRDAKAIAHAVDAVGATIGADATFEATILSCSALRRELGTCLDLLPEMVEQPAFDSEELDKMRAQMRASNAQRLSDPVAVATLHVQNLLWTNDHVRGWVNSDQSIAQITRDDLVAWHRSWFSPGNAMLVVVGDVDAKAVQGDLERAFGGWAKAPVAPHPTYPEPGLSGTRIRLVDWPGLPQAQIRVGQFGIRHDDPKFFPSLVWNYVLGGNSPSTRLAQRLKGGGASAFDRNVDRGSFVAQTIARNADAVVATELVLGEITRMAKDGPTDVEVAQAIANLSGQWAIRFQSAADIGAALIGAKLHNLDESYLTGYGPQVGKVDPATARLAAAQVLDPKNFVIVILGDAKDIEPQLQKKGWRYDKVAFTEPVSPIVQAPIDPKVLAATKKFLEDALVVKGGRAKVSALTSIRFEESGTTTAAGVTTPVDMERAFVIPDKLRIDARFAVGSGGQQARVVYAIDGGSGWVERTDPQDPSKSVVDVIPAAQMGAIDFERWRDADLILLKALDPHAKLTPLPDETVNGKPQVVVRLASPFVNVDVTLYFDKATKLMTRMSYDDGGFTSTDDFSDYRGVDGVQLAYKRPTHDRARDIQLTVKKAELNVPLAASAFLKPTNHAATPPPPPPSPPAPAPSPSPSPGK
jgi:predicted Zn-dependent peptidase